MAANMDTEAPQRGEKRARSEMEGPAQQEGDTEGRAKKVAKRLPKRKVALLMGYVGTGYYGMQWQGYVGALRLC